MTIMPRALAADTRPWATDPGAFQRRLARFNAVRLAPATPEVDGESALIDEFAMRAQELGWLQAELGQVADRAAAAPTNPDGFMDWFQTLLTDGPGQGDALFPWLAADADMADMRWFLEQEAAGEAGFDDLVALTQVKLPDRPKMELARNYWDEMGRGNLNGMHGRLFDALTARLNLRPTIDGTVPESLALANTMVAFAANRRYAWHSVGALGVVELTAPGRVAQVAQGLRRLGFSDRERRYFDLHAVLDVKHSEAWNAEAVRPLMETQPHVGRWIAEGALMRLECGRRCFDAYRAALWTERRVAA